MPQVSLYMDRQSLRRIATAARREKKSVSAWARERLLREVKPAWPDEFLAALGSVEAGTLARPSQPPLHAPRESNR